MSMPNIDELRKMIADPHIAVIVSCALVSETKPLKPGATRDYWCGLCHRETQASPNAVEQIKAGGLVLCKPCTLELIAARERIGGQTDLFGKVPTREYPD